jgi:hypothetical protein
MTERLFTIATKLDSGLRPTLVDTDDSDDGRPSHE